MEELKLNTQTNNRWDSYIKRAKYAAGLTFEEVINHVTEWINDVVES